MLGISLTQNFEYGVLVYVFDASPRVIYNKQYFLLLIVESYLDIHPLPLRCGIDSILNYVVSCLLQPSWISYQEFRKVTMFV